METEMYWSNMSEETCSSSSEDETGSSYSYESEESSLRMEDVVVCGKKLSLPQGLCEKADVFKNLISKDTWLGFSEQQRQHLKNFLPSFPDNDSEEKDTTMRLFLARENIRFGNPLNEFHKQLKAGHYRPDINKMRRLLKNAQYKEYKHQQRRYYFQLMKSILVSRHRLLEAASRGSPGIIPRPEKIPQVPPRPSPVHQRVRRRYFQELAAVREEVGESSQSSDDENYPEGPPAGLNKKQKRQLASLENSFSPDLKPVTSTLACKPSGLDLEQRVTPSHNPYDISDEAYREMLIRHRKRRLRGEVHPDLQTKGITTNEVMSRSQILKKSTHSKSSAKKPKLKSSQQLESLNIQIKEEIDGDITSESETVGGIEEEIETEKVDVVGDDDTLVHIPQPVHTPTSTHRRISSTTTPNSSSRNSKSANKTGSKVKIKLEPPDESLVSPITPTLAPQVQSTVLSSPVAITQTNDSSYRQGRLLTPATLSDLDGIDMMDLPVDLEEPDITFSQADIKPELTQETHACFFSLLRDIICSTPDHRMTLSMLGESVKAWSENPISPLNDWYHIATADINGCLSSALNFLSGDYIDWQPEEFVPYLEYKANLQAYQWIGAGRDSDTHLMALCRHWLERREDMTSRTIKEEDIIPSEIEREKLIVVTPPPRFPTTWTVTSSTPDEREHFREQEKIRYENPHKAFTYRMHGYESVVGPVKGMYCPTVAINKPRGHSLLSLSRPNYVTILALVRDATARLPNGQGTRSDICTLLRDSQYLIPNAPDADLNSVVSGALDRLHYECDPCVKYDTKRKIWIYLHRSRTEEEAERMHQEQQKATKPKNSRKAQRAAKALAQNAANPVVQVKQDAGVSPRTNAVTPVRPVKAQTQKMQVTTTLKPMPELKTEIKKEPGLEVEDVINQVAKPAVLAQQRTVPIKQTPSKSLISSASLAAAAKKASLTAQKQLSLDSEVKSIMGKSSKKGGQSTKSVKNVQNVKTEVAKPAIAAVRRIPDKPVTAQIGSGQPTVLSAVRHIPDAQIPTTMPVHTIKQKALTTSVLSAVRRLPIQDSQGKPVVASRVKTLKALKEPISILDQNITSAGTNAKKKMTASAGVQATADPTPVLTKVTMAQAKSIVKMITTQAAVRAVQSPTQVTSQQMMLLKQAQQQFLNEPSSSGKQQQLIVMKQSTDNQSATSQPQMIVINQQQIVTDQLTAKQHKQLQQILVKQQFEQQPQQTITIQQQQLQQLILAKQQQIMAEQQKSGKPQQQMIVLKQQPQQQVTANQQPHSDQQKTQQLQQMILVKQQQQQLLTGEHQQITQQQLQQMLLMKQQQPQQSSQQQSMIFVKQQTDQKTISSPTQVQTKTLVQQQQQTQSVQQSLSLAQLQQLQQQQQQRVVSSTSLLSQPRVQVSVSGQVISSGSTSMIKSSQSQPMIAKMVTNAQGQPVITMESLLGHQKQHGSLQQGTVRVAGKPGIQPQYTVVSVGQPRVIQASQISQPSSTTVAGTSGASVSAQQSTAGKIVTTVANQGNQIRMSGINLAHIGGKPVLLASKPQSLQAQNVILASQGTVSTGGQTVLLASQGLRGQPTGAQGTLTVLQQGGQQILLPQGFHASALNIKTLQGLKVIPLTPAQAAAPNKGSPNRQQLFARILNPAGMRPVVANIVQTEATPLNPPTTTEQ